MTLTERLPACAAGKDPQELIQEVVASFSHIAMLPEIAHKITRLVENTRSTAQDLHNLIRHDPALVARILREANSAFYGFPRQISSISRAIALLGSAAVKNIAIAASLPRLFCGGMINAELCQKELWTHSIAVAVMSRLIVRMLNNGRADEAFLAGLIHDMGMLVELQALRDPLAEITAMAAGMGAERYMQIERNVLGGVDHQALGAAVASNWRFPLGFQYVIGFHHEPLSLPADCRWMTCVVYLADHVCCQRGLGYSLTCRSEELDDAVLSVLGLTPEMVEALAVDLPKGLQEIEVLLA